MSEHQEPEFEVWQELRMTGQKEALARFLDWVDSNLPKGWEKTESFTDESPHRHAYRLKNFGHGGLKYWLWQKNQFEIYVQNIVPDDERDNAGHEQMLSENARRLLLFKDAVIDPATAHNPNVSILVEQSHKTLEDFVPVETAKLLRAFSRAANRGSGNKNPHDRERWLKFLFDVHESNADERLTYALLKEWLTKDGWTEESAARLANDYSSSLDLLQFYDRHKADLPLF